MPAATITVVEAMRRVCTLLQDDSPQFNRWIETELVDWFNDGQAAIVKYLPASSSGIYTIKLVTGVLQSIEQITAENYLLHDGSTPSVTLLGNQLMKVMNNMGIDGLTVGRIIRVIDQDVLDQNNPNWMLTAQAASVVRQYVFDAEQPRFFMVQPPIPASPAVWARVALSSQPTKIPNTGTPGDELYGEASENATVISVSDEFIDDLVNYVVARANMKDAEFADNNKATFFGGQFVSSINAKAATLTGTSPNLKMLPMASQQPVK